VSVQQELASRTLTRQIPIVVVTGSRLYTDTLDVACVLRKPVMPDELVRTVRHCLRAATPAAGA
jgi:CheY-like chemotaxis protein